MKRDLGAVFRCGAAVLAVLALCALPEHRAWAQRAATGEGAAPPASAQRQAQRLALVMGNAHYRDAPLANPVNDARAMAQALREAGFTVMLHTDLDHRGMTQAVREFGTQLRQGGMGLFYFAGHGIQIRGRNYLIPVGADIQREDEVAYAALDAQAVLDKMESAGNGTNLMILDACRNNPFARSFRSQSTGLAQMEAPVGTLVAFATAPGTVASDGPGRNGLYTQNLLAAMRKPGLKVEDVFKQVRVAVRRDSAGKQVPWESTSLEGDLYFSAPPAAEPATPALTAEGVEAALWASVENSSDPAEIRVFLRRYPDSRFATTARQRLARLVPQNGPQSQKPPPVPAAGDVVMPARPSPTVVVPSNGGRAESARRTDELLAEMSGPPRPAAEVAPAPGGRADRGRKPPASNVNGYTVGDSWSFQVVDKWRGEVVRNYTWRVADIGPFGELNTAGGSVLDAHGRLQRSVDRPAQRVRTYSPHLPRWWEGMKVGDEQKLAFSETLRSLADDLIWSCEHKASARFVATEGVRVPAGEFSASRIEIDGTCTRTTPGQPGTFHAWRHVLWYVPALRYYVAFEWEWRDASGKLERREREELTSYITQATKAAR